MQTHPLNSSLPRPTAPSTFLSRWAYLPFTFLSNRADCNQNADRKRKLKSQIEIAIASLHHKHNPDNPQNTSRNAQATTPVQNLASFRCPAPPRSPSRRPPISPSIPLCSFRRVSLSLSLVSVSSLAPLRQVAPLHSTPLRSTPLRSTPSRLQPSWLSQATLPARLLACQRVWRPDDRHGGGAEEGAAVAVHRHLARTESSWTRAGNNSTVGCHYVPVRSRRGRTIWRRPDVTEAGSSQPAAQ